MTTDGATDELRELAIELATTAGTLAHEGG